jgi:dsDNA-binding SOS-regulon protein
MVNLIKNNKTSLGVSAVDANFDSTLVAIDNLLKTQTIDLATQFDSTANDTAFFRVSLTNKAGHKFPSGYPARRAVLQFVALKPNGDTLFASGVFDSIFEVKNIATPFEVHHNTITNQNNAQIYEMVMGDVNGNLTTVLERSAIHLKDNRIPPLGFTTTHISYDTVQIVGDALTDPDFNKILTVEGSGKDIVHYNIPLNGYIGSLNIVANLYYQAVPPRWLDEMRTFSSAEIDTFLTMYDNADRSPVLVSNDTLQNILITTGIKNIKSNNTVTISPNPTNNGVIKITGINTTINKRNILVYNAGGQQVPTFFQVGNSSITLKLPEIEGIYYISILDGTIKHIKKVVYLK